MHIYYIVIIICDFICKHLVDSLSNLYSIFVVVLHHKRALYYYIISIITCIIVYCDGLSTALRPFNNCSTFRLLLPHLLQQPREPSTLFLLLNLYNGFKRFFFFLRRFLSAAARL